ncbi:hypothetical protein N7478_001850 [Penicillium angulare]|uniref:uncharacterized protein n=1 Tax=Penicillium angulare TaxID=116970 RepID=UPI00253F68AB|nr:uncharacterized protein N7478_001850 [Penicillium angulare]KAJ5288820.1 hypothetical protein N7478_001850 [Penicillium angulare]
MFLAIDSGPTECVQISSTYINICFPMDIPQASGIDLYFDKDAWYQIFTHIQQLSNKSQMLERAVTAISLVCLGKVEHDDTLVEQGIWWYNSSIRRLLHIITRNEWSEEVVFATIMFQMLEIASVVESSITRLSLGGEPSEEDTLLDELFRFLEPVSDLVSEWNTRNKSDWQAAKPALHACLDYRQQALSWYARRKFVIEPAFHQPDGPVTTEQDPSNYPFGTHYSFSNLGSASLHVAYWTLLVLIEDTIQRILNLVSPGSVDEELIYLNERSIGHKMSEFYADEICRSLPYCLAGVHGAWGLGSLTGLLTQIARPYIALRRCEKLNYCLSIYEMARNNGLGMARGMADFILNLWTSFGSSTGESLKLNDSEYITTPKHASEDNNKDSELHALVEASKYPRRVDNTMPWRVFRFVEESAPSTSKKT